MNLELVLLIHFQAQQRQCTRATTVGTAATKCDATCERVRGFEFREGLGLGLEFPSPLGKKIHRRKTSRKSYRPETCTIAIAKAKARSALDETHTHTLAGDVEGTAAP